MTFTQRSRTVWDAASGGITVTIERCGDEYLVAETRRQGGKASGRFHGSCSTYAGAEAAGLAILAGAHDRS